MRHGLSRLVLVMGAGLMLAGCNAASNTSLSDSFGLKDTPGAAAFAAAPDEAAPQTAAFGEPTPEGALLGADPGDDLSTGKAYFRSGNYGMAERYFRRAVEQHPTDAEAWLDLGASYDHVKRFDLADRAYEKLNEAFRRAPGNPYVMSNLRLLQASAAQSKAIE